MRRPVVIGAVVASLVLTSAVALDRLFADGDRDEDGGPSAGSAPGVNPVGAAKKRARKRARVAKDPTALWRPQADPSLGAGVELRRSPNRRCSLATVKVDGNPDADKLEAAVVQRLTAAGLVLGDGDRTRPFQRGDIAGRVALRRDEDNGSGAWHLRACFYRKRDENVCQSSCNTLL